MPENPKSSKAEKAWAVYIVRCSDGTFYTGISNDVDKRVAVHNSGKGAKYTSSRLPVELIYSEPSENRSTATKRERAVKKLSRARKMDLIHNGLP